MSNTAQLTFDGEQADDRVRPETLLYCPTCETTVLRSERFEHEHDLVETDGDDTDGDADEAAEATDKPLGWAVWVEESGRGNRDECITVLADSEADATEQAREESQYDDVTHVDGPFEDPDAGVWEFTYTTEHKETVVVEAPFEEYAEESADAVRDHHGEFIQTVRTDVRKLGQKDRHTVDD